MTPQATYDVLTVLISKAQTLQAAIGATVGSNGFQVKMGQVSEQTGYGLPEVIVEDILFAQDLILGSYNKLIAMQSPTTEPL